MTPSLASLAPSTTAPKVFPVAAAVPRATPFWTPSIKTYLPSSLIAKLAVLAARAVPTFEASRAAPPAL